MIKTLGLILALCAALTNCTAAELASGAEVPQTASGAPERQVLIMLHLPPLHYHPGANYAGRYGDDSGHKARRRIAEDLARLHGLKLITDWPMPLLGIDCYVMEQEQVTGNTPERIADMLSRDPRVEWAQPMRLFHPLAGNAPNPLYAVQPSAKYWHIAEIHKVATGRNVIVAVVDSGVEDTHPDLAGQVAVKENFVDGNPYAPEEHGTAVAGIIAARIGNGAGIVGVAPGARVMALRACWQEPKQDTKCSSFTLGRALNFAILHDAKVINLSLSGPPDRLLQRLLDVALARDISVVGAVDPHRIDGGFPASYPGVIAVAEQFADSEGNTGGPNWLRAPGSDIPTTAIGARWGFVSGSSYAAAHVSGMVALLSELRPSLTPAQIRWEIAGNAADKSLLKTVANHQAASVDSRQGGTIDACGTISRITGTCACSCATANASKVTNYQ